MDYMVSRSFVLPETKAAMVARSWYVLWQRPVGLYRELTVGDTLYWYETPSQTVVWQTQVVRVERRQYSSKTEITGWLRREFPPFDETERYFQIGPSAGYCMAWQAKPLERLALSRPNGEAFPQSGWLRVTDDVAGRWLNRAATPETARLDDFVGNLDDLRAALLRLNEQMKYLSPQRVQSVINTTIRGDSALVRKLKQVHQWRCQFPSCGTTIKKKGGGFYAEVAHIAPVRTKGQSVIGNLLVLCPNHHKEFDHGDLRVSRQAEDVLEGVLNGRSFTISLSI